MFSIIKNSRFERDGPLSTNRAIFRWWEDRRLFFNLAVGGTGIITCALMVTCAVIADSTVDESIGMPDGPLLGVFMIPLYGIAANICYTFGWIYEMLLRAALSSNESSSAFGQKAFRAGLAFSVVLTLSPAFLCWVVFLVALAHGQKHGPVGE